MLKHKQLCAALFLAVLLVVGCGGTGDTDANNPNGTFSFGLSPNADGELGHAMAIEIDAEGGEIIGGFAHFVETGLVAFYTDKVSGTASEGSINATCDFGPYDVEINAVYSGLGWHGTYQVFEGKKVIEEGDLTIDRTGSATPNISGFWEGTVSVDGDLTFEMGIDQKGNFLNVEAEIDGAFYVGGGTVVGKSVSIAMDLDGSDIWLYGKVNSGVTNFNGDGVGKGSFTFQLEKVIVRPDKGSSTKIR